jgi:tRNA(Ile)-lysidine synthase
LLSITSFLQQHPPAGAYLLAVSGGMDSVALCALAHEEGLDFAIAHCNFGLRGEESDRDEAFVRGLGTQYGVEVFVKRFDTAAVASESRRSVQETARSLRYEWFDELRQERGFAWTLLAHHANDNIETLLMNFFRGTGLDGLTGIPEAAHSHCLRPMLRFTRSQIEAYVREKGLKWVEDSSNASDKYTRNYFRNNLLPQIKEVYPRVEENLLNNVQRFRQTQKLYRQMLDKLKAKMVRKEGAEARVSVLELMKYKDTSLIYEIIRDYGFGEKQVAEVIRLSSSEGGRFIENEGWQIIRHGRWFIIAPKKEAATAIAIADADTPVTFAGGKLSFRLLPASPPDPNLPPTKAWLDASQITFPLVLRKWKQGDYFYPLGLRKKKKLARFFIDQKLPRNRKEEIWVLESNKKIVWVIGLRIDDRFKLTEKTKEKMEVEVHGP